MAYLTEAEARDRLWTRYGINSDIQPGDIEIASNALDDMGPFIGYRSDGEQTHAFPRSTTVAGDTESVVPARILDWVALKAYEVSTNEGPAVQSESAGSVSVTYVSPKVSQNTRRMEELLAPYFRKTGRRL